MRTLTFILLLTLFVPAFDELPEALKSGTLNAQIRYYSIQRNYDELKENSDGVFDEQYSYKKASNAIGGYIGYTSREYLGISVGATVYTSQPIFRNPLDEGGLQLLRDDQDGYTVVGEAYLQWTKDNTLVKIGRERLSEYRFLSDMDIRMTPYTYEAAIVENRDLENITLRIAAVKGLKSVASTSFIDFVNAAKNPFIEQTIDRNPLRGDYDPADFDANHNYIGPKKNLYLASIVYDDRRYHFELWDYYAADFVNFIYTEGSYSFQTDDFRNLVALQAIKQNNTGDSVAGSINTWEYGIKLQTSYKGLTLTYAFDRVKYDENSLDGGSIIDTWGNNMIYNSLFYNGGDQAGTTANSLTANYVFCFSDLEMIVTAAKIDLPNKLMDIFADQDNYEYDFVLKYRPDWNKKLQFKLETIYVDFNTDYNFRAYEDLHGFDMLHAYDNIMDLRFIVNYTF